MDRETWLDPRSRPDGVIRIVSFNVRNGRSPDVRNCWWRRRRAVLETITRLDPDLVGLQEPYAFQLRWLSGRLVDHAWVGVGRTDGHRRGEHCAVFYRRARFVPRRFETRWFGASPSVPGTKLPGARFARTATLVELEDRRGDSAIVFVNTHLDAHVAANRLSSAAQLAAWVATVDAPVVIAGDLNEGVDGPALELLVARTGLRHTCPPDAGGSNHDFTGRRDGPRIDHILVPPSLRVVAGGIDHRPARGRLASDHWPVIADVVVPSPT
jgi:endonuclease/exonuclease/phosphatase family metal-dependent hydrolase